MDELIQGVLTGRRRAIARMITQVENSAAAARTAVTALYPHTGRAHIVGITGSPGSGKSTLVNELAKAYRALEKEVGIIAVDPSSPFTGGALLGDRVRMRDLSGDAGIFIRSLASRGSLGGLSQATGAAVKVLDAAGFDIILIETVGAGQAEVDIAATAHTTLVIEAPGMGDEIQTIKAGILEIADVLVVNKADRPGAEKTVRALKMMLHLGVRTRTQGDASAAWEVPVQKTVAPKGEGVADLVAAVQGHYDFLKESGEWTFREQERSRQEITQLLQAHFMRRLHETVPAAEREALIAAVAAREIDPYSAVAALFAQTAA